MPDYNPDREGHRDHKWIVHKAIRGNMLGVTAAERNMAFDREGRFSVKDEAVAAEIRKKYPRAVTVTRVNANSAADRGHKYFFASVAMPWHEDEDGKEKET